jgi:hypothetical protein
MDDITSVCYEIKIKMDFMKVGTCYGKILPSFFGHVHKSCLFFSEHT